MTKCMKYTCMVCSFDTCIVVVGVHLGCGQVEQCQEAPISLPIPSPKWTTNRLDSAISPQAMPWYIDYLKHMTIQEQLHHLYYVYLYLAVCRFHTHTVRSHPPDICRFINECSVECYLSMSSTPTYMDDGCTLTTL